MSAGPRFNPEPTQASGVSMVTEGDRTVIVTPTAWECGCGAMALVLVNRGGRTRCVRCDAQFRDSQSPAVPSGAQR